MAGKDGRPSKMTPDVVERACKRIVVTGNVISAFATEGVSKSTVLWWLQIAEGRDDQHPPTPRFLDFLSAVNLAKAQHSDKMIELEVSPVETTTQRQVTVRGAPGADGTPGPVKAVIQTAEVKRMTANPKVIDAHLRRENPEEYPDTRTVKHGLDDPTAALLAQIRALKAEPYTDPRMLPAGGDDDENVVDAETVEPVESEPVVVKRPVTD